MTVALIKIFAKGFFREHAGFLIFLFVMFFSYFFFIQVLNPHLTREQLIMHNLKLALTFISTPIMTILIFGVWLVYAVKSWNFIRRQLNVPANQFLFYSMTAMSKAGQFKSWFVVQSVIFIPVIAYGIFSITLGLTYSHYLIPSLIVAYVIVLIAISAIVYTYYLSQMDEGYRTSILIQFTRHWRKPVFSLDLNHIADRLKLTYVLTKSFSVVVILSFFHVFPALATEPRLVSIMLVCIVSVHSVIIYQSHRFEETRLIMFRNLPFSRASIVLQQLAGLLLLVSPEVLWLAFRFEFPYSIVLTIGMISILMLFKSILLMRSGEQMKFYIKSVFGLFVVFFIMAVYGLQALMVLVSFVTAIALFFYFYFRKEVV